MKYGVWGRKEREWSIAAVIASDPESVEGERGNPGIFLDCFVVLLQDSSQ